MQRKNIDIQSLSEMWYDQSVHLMQIAVKFGVAPSTLSRIAKDAGLPPRSSIVPHKDSHRVDAGEDAASGDSLRLSPSIERLADEVRSKWTDEQEYAHRVMRVQPMVVQSFSFERREQ